MLATGFRIGGSVHIREQRNFLYPQGIDNDVNVKPTLSREKCVCLQNLNKILCVLDNKSQSDIYRQSVQKEFKRFFIFGF